MTAVVPLTTPRRSRALAPSTTTSPTAKLRSPTTSRSGPSWPASARSRWQTLLSWSTWARRWAVDHRLFPGLVGLPPVGDQGAVAVVAGLERSDAVMLGVGGDRLLQVAGADVVDGPLLPGLDLPAVDGQLGGAQAEAEGAEAAAGLDGGELAVVADQHHLGPRPLGMAEQGGELAGGDHGGLVHHQHRSGRPARSGHAWRSSSSRSTVRASVKPSSARPTVAIPVGAAPEDLVAVQLEGLPGQPQRPGLARPGPPHHHRHPGAALGEVTDHGRLVLPGGGVAVQDLADDLRPDDGAALARPAGGAVDQLPLKSQQLRG